MSQSGSNSAAGSGSGGSSTFTSLTVTPGPTHLTGALTVIAAGHDINIGTDNTDHAVNIGVDSGSSPTQILSGGGGVFISSDQGLITLTTTGAQGILAQTNGGGPLELSTIGGGALNIQTDSGPINLNSARIFPIGSSATAASPVNAVTINTNVGSAIFTGFTTAAAASQQFVFNNSLVATNTAALFVTASNNGANDAKMTVSRVQTTTGSITVTLTNTGTQALNGSVTIAFWVIVL